MTPPSRADVFEPDRRVGFEDLASEVPRVVVAVGVLGRREPRAWTGGGASVPEYRDLPHSRAVLRTRRPTGVKRQRSGHSSSGGAGKAPGRSHEVSADRRSKG